MFTGLIEELGVVVLAAGEAEGRRLRIRAPKLCGDLAAGDSIAVSGVCLTVSGAPSDGCFEVVSVAETLRRTTLGALRAGSRVHLERSLRLGDRLGGHWVNGHVEAKAPILSTGRSGSDSVFVIGLPSSVVPYVVEKGSIAVDGVSLTVGEVEPERFRVYIIPETRVRTLFGRYRQGDLVNLEPDILAKYADRSAQAGSPGSSGAWKPETWRILETWRGGES